jgi:hypothetical protein
MISKMEICVTKKGIGITYRKLILPSVFAVCALISGCTDSAKNNDSAIGNDSATIWSGEAQSPDKHYVASARTEQDSGFGTAAVYTTVYLKQNAQKPTAILVFANETAYPLGVTAVDMTWITPSHLSVAYKGNANIEFQVIKCAGVEISIEKKG